jgi:ABC-2 type transport system ATP-binding protein
VASARQIRQMLAELHRAGTTILLTTHYIEEAERLCDRIAFIVSGRIVRTDVVAELMEPIKGRHSMSLSLSAARPPLRDELAAAFPHLLFDSISDGQVHIESSEPIAVSPLVRFLEDRGVEVVEARRLRPSLEDVFVRITGLEAAAMRKEKAGAGA